MLDFKLSASNGAIKLSWRSVKGACSYDIYRADQLLANVTKNSYTDENPVYNDNNAYYVVPKKYNMDGHKSETRDIFADPVYKSANLIDIAKDPAAYQGKYVQIGSLTRVNSYRTGAFNENVVIVVSRSDGNKNYYAFLVLEYYDYWNWTVANDLLSANPSRFSASGQVTGTSAYEDRGDIPVLTITDVNW